MSHNCIWVKVDTTLFRHTLARKLESKNVVTQARWTNVSKSSLKHFKCDFHNSFCIKLPFSFAHMKFENLGISRLPLQMQVFKPQCKLWAINYYGPLLKTLCINQLSFQAVSLSKVLSHFLEHPVTISIDLRFYDFAAKFNKIAANC